MSRPDPVVARFREAGAGEAGALTDLERDANLVALRHVFDPAEHAYPYAAVLARWDALLADPEVVVEVVDQAVGDRDGLAVLLARDAGRVRHLAVHPSRWSQGLATAALDRAETALRASGADDPRLWCLVENHRARALYEPRGWRATGRRRPAAFAPYPVEMEYVLW
ncbi:MAG: GNAT family N-acetyltransferase [Nocardioides sp.]|nr:GNAT family N-acetyltransferase [Nocardioides sp.]